LNWPRAEIAGHKIHEFCLVIVELLVAVAIVSNARMLAEGDMIINR